MAPRLDVTGDQVIWIPDMGNAALVLDLEQVIPEPALSPAGPDEGFLHRIGEGTAGDLLNHMGLPRLFDLQRGGEVWNDLLVHG